MLVILDKESEEGDAPAPIDMVDEQLECEDIELHFIWYCGVFLLDCVSSFFQCRQFSGVDLIFKLSPQEKVQWHQFWGTGRERPMGPPRPSHLFGRFSSGYALTSR
ncbi:hypothetical protein AVEN_116009-1 [Araneus ventricosus]|uniref:Uncharacterized protein n=2 Tax=Araneus ventricosus TaxID=182803 RepID=A0A4Y2EK40_ARAVE|nr:hypothetical protein AVEN_116009-1 [Araneus ventricosus]